MGIHYAAVCICETGCLQIAVVIIQSLLIKIVQLFIILLNLLLREVMIQTDNLIEQLNEVK